MTNEPTKAELQQRVETLEAQAAVDRAVVDHLEADGVIDRDKIANLEIALTSCRVIGTAIGVLMAIQKITDVAAFELLRTTSQHEKRKLREVADDVVRTGTLVSPTD
jgi:tetrahydromethanopterin S-methyltransferase subunit F